MSNASQDAMTNLDILILNRIVAAFISKWPQRSDCATALIDAIIAVQPAMSPEEEETVRAMLSVVTRNSRMFMRLLIEIQMADAGRSRLNDWGFLGKSRDILDGMLQGVGHELADEIAMLRIIARDERLSTFD